MSGDGVVGTGHFRITQKIKEGYTDLEIWRAVAISVGVIESEDWKPVRQRLVTYQSHILLICEGEELPLNVGQACFWKWLRGQENPAYNVEMYMVVNSGQLR